MGWQDDKIEGVSWQKDQIVPYSGPTQTLLPGPQVPANPTEGMSNTQKFLAGAGMGMTNVGRGIGQLVGAVTPEQVAEARARDAALSGSGAGMAGDIAGNMALTMVPGARATSALANAGARMLPAAAGVMPTAAAGLTGAGIAAGTVPLAPGESRAVTAGLGAVGGMGGDLAARTLARGVHPLAQSPETQALLARGIVPTPGQAVGGTAREVESKLTSIPFLGDVIRWGSRRPVRETQLAAIQTVDPKIKKIGNEGVQEAQRSADQAYDSALSKFTVVPDRQFVAQTRRIESDSSILLTQEQRGQFRAFVQDTIVDPLKKQPQVLPPSGTNVVPINAAVSTPQQGSVVVTGKLWKEIDSELGSKAREYSGNNATASERNLGRAFAKLQSEWRELVERNAPPEVVAEVVEANRKWANLVIVERAAAKSKTGNGEFTPSQLQQAVRESDPTVRKRAFAAGNARGQDLSNPAVNVLGGGYPDSGTAGRYLLGSTILGGAGYAAGGPEGSAVGLGVPLGLAALASPLYTRAGGRYMLGGYPGQVPTADLLRSLAPFSAQMGRDVTTR